MSPSQKVRRGHAHACAAGSLRAVPSGALSRPVADCRRTAVHGRTAADTLPSARRCHPMPASPRGRRRAAVLVTAVLAALAAAGPKASPFWDVDDIREGMAGVGRTVLKGTKLEEFRVEVLGV